jgi:hypothetical protein
MDYKKGLQADMWLCREILSFMKNSHVK